MQLGKRLRRLRQKRNLTQEELADRCELSKGFISQVERDLTSPSIATLKDILESLGSDLKTFFSEETREQIVFSEEDMSLKEDEEELKGSITWLIPNAQKNDMEPVLVKLLPGGKTQLVQAHEGEEIGYVLQGEVSLVEGDSKYTVQKGSSFCIHPGEPHYIINSGRTEATFIWVSAPPAF
ncbi:MAG: XRE family transcriptional regulator [Eubacteriales bacterium]|nr:XRE family transcriptional regulator [Eubacteriales bacterium]